MSRLYRRITTQPSAHPQAMGQYHPFGTPDTPLAMPAHLISHYPGGATFEQLALVPAPGGGHAAARYPGTWGNVYQAGRP